MLLSTRGWRLTSSSLRAGSQAASRVSLAHCQPRRACTMAASTEAKPKKQKQQQQTKKGGGGGGGGFKALTSREADFSSWYQEVIAAADLVDQSPVKGCMVIKPSGMALWEAIREDLDKRIKASGAQNAYFPLFIPD